jgi:hypothetical protein
MGKFSETVAANAGGEVNGIGSCEADNIRSRQKENRSRSASEVGASEGAAEEGCLATSEPAASYAAGFPSCLIQKICPETLHLATLALAGC